MKLSSIDDCLRAAVWWRCFVVGCLVVSLTTNISCQGFSTESISRNNKPSTSLLRSSSEDTTTTVATIPESDDDENEMEELTTTPTDLLSSSPNEYFGRNGYSMTSGYSRFLYTQEEKPNWWTKIRRKKKRSDADMNEDGYADMQQRGHNRSFLQKVVRLPFKTAKKIIAKDNQEPGTLILVRHGESEWNKNKTFTGWADPGKFKTNTGFATVILFVFGGDHANEKSDISRW